MLDLFDLAVAKAINGDSGGGGGTSGLSEAVKQALLQVIENVAYTTPNGETYYQALYDALYPSAPPAELVSISAVFTQGSVVIYETDSLDTLKQYLVVTATYDDSTTANVSAYTLSGTLAVGTSTITVSYGGKTTTFNVTVSEYVPTAKYVEVGSPSIVNNVLYPTNSNGGYIRTPQEFNHGSNPWKIKFAFASASSSQTANVFLTANANGERIRSVQCQQVNAFLQIYLSSNNSSWDINSGANAKFWMNPFVANTKYFVEYSFNGEKYSISVTDENGDSVASGNLSSSAPVYDGGYLSFGLVTSGTAAFNGQIFLEDIEVYINNQLWWKAVG